MDKSNPFLEEAARLFAMGLAPHWLKPNSKAPVKSGWTSGARDSLESLRADYQNGYGLGVRLGTASKFNDGGYLANVDVDIKSTDPRHKAEALALLDTRLPGVKAKAALVKTGYGYRFFVRTDKPLPSGKLGASGEETVVFMPTSPVNKRQLMAVESGLLSRADLDRGYRVRPAWEVEFMSEGKQVVLPPTIHPDTKTPYIWRRELHGNGDVPRVAVVSLGLSDRTLNSGGRPQGTGFTPVEVNLFGSKLADKYVDMITEGVGVEDRSAACYSVTLAMLRAGFKDDEIISVLTDRDYYLGETAFDHRQTTRRDAAANWVRDYCLAKAKGEVSAAKVFAREVIVTPPLERSEAVAQVVEVCGAERPWKERLKRTGKHGDGPPAPVLHNILLILQNVVSPSVFVRDSFALRDAYGANALWSEEAKTGKLVDDDDAISIKVWLSAKWGFEPNTNLVHEAISHIAGANAFHPVREWLDGLEPWDGKSRLDTWLGKYFEAKGSPEYLGQVFRKWMVGAVKRVMEPGCKFDWMPLLEGGQGFGKSSFGSILFGQDWFSDRLEKLNDKDAIIGLHGKWCVEFGELSALNKNEVETVKAFVTRQTDVYRPPFGRRSVGSPRQTVFFATTNKQSYFRDDTGNRRFRPVVVGKLNFERLRKDREQLWAEAYFIYLNGLEETLELSGVAAEEARELEDTKLVASEAELASHRLVDFIVQELKKPEAERFNFNKFRLQQLFSSFGPFEKWPENGRSIHFIVNSLHTLGAENRSIKGLKWWKIDKLERFLD